MARKKKTNFLELIHEQRSATKKEKFDGTFIEYLELVQENPDVAKLAHKRLCDAIEGHGVAEMQDDEPRKYKLFGGDNVKLYDYFEGEFFGMEKVISKVMRYLKSASLKGEESRQVLLLMGPVGAGKSA